MQLEHTKLQRNLSIQDFSRNCGGKEQDWLKTTEVRELLKDERAHALVRRANMCDSGKAVED